MTCSNPKCGNESPKGGLCMFCQATQEVGRSQVKKVRLSERKQKAVKK